MEEAVDQLDAILKERFGCPEGILKNTTFSGNTEEAFQQLSGVLKECKIVQAKSNSAPAKKAEGHETLAVGEIAYAFWHGNGWFTARIEEWIPHELNYSIRWTDGNWAPERAFYKNICVDRVPDASTIGVGTKVLFQQGLYWCGYDDDGTVADSSGRTLSEEKKAEINNKGQVSERWHMGHVTRVFTDDAGHTLYDGLHVSSEDSQASNRNYPEFDMKFTGLKIEQLRTTTNLFNSPVKDKPDEAFEANIHELQENLDKLDISPTDRTKETLIHPSPKDVGEKQSSVQNSVPKVGDSVICRYAAWQFFPAKIVRFDSESMNYTVDWDDPDPTNRVQPFNMVAVNREPTDDQIGIGSRVLFIQGTYSYGDSSGDVWNLGEITKIEEVDGEKLYSGKHSKTAADGLAVAGWSSYTSTFERHTRKNLRLFPDAIEMLNVYKSM